MSDVKIQKLGGLLLIAGVVVALALANSPFESAYHAFAELEWLKGAAIFIFFASIGIELRHEITHGVLSKPRQAVVPVFAAIGGMAVPATIFLLINKDTPNAVGWGVPMSTDIAFALSVFVIIANRLPKSIRTLLLAIAVVDDALSILIITFFYASEFHLLSVVSLAGVLVGVFMPKGQTALPTIQKIVNLAALPLFALMSAGIVFAHIDFSTVLLSPLAIGIIVAAVIGKPLGVLGTIAAVTKSKLGKLSPDVKWADLIPVGFLFGMCFTVALLISELAFGHNESSANTAKLSIFIAATTAALIASIAMQVRKLSRV